MCVQCVEICRGYNSVCVCNELRFVEDTTVCVQCVEICRGYNCVCAMC